ncbi:four-helix bundle copper-binding protein, partial [Autumnicola patrickiae]
EECEKFDLKHCRDCAQACRECANNLRNFTA